MRYNCIPDFIRPNHCFVHQIKLSRRWDVKSGWYLHCDKCDKDSRFCKKHKRALELVRTPDGKTYRRCSLCKHDPDKENI